jgi:3',5'-cyclic AMP phosphodiesterase CpdA
MNPQSVRRLLPVLALTLLVFACSLGPAVAKPIEPDKQTKLSEPLLFSFAQMCDTQLGMGGYEHDVKTFGLAVDQINQMKPDFVVICGDLVSKANDKSWADFKRIKAGFKIPCHCAAGNHDVGNKPTAESLRRYREKIGKDYYTVDHKGYTFVIANTQLWKAPLKGESEKHDAWFKAALAAAKKKASPIVVVVHYPLFVKTPDEKENYYNIAPAKRMELLKLCEENGVVAFLAGHTHKLVINQYKGIQMVNGETTSKNFDKRPMGFRWWDVGTKGKMVHRFVQLEGMGE